MEVETIKEEYDFSESQANPYVKRERRQVTMNLDVEVLDYFKREAARTGIPYQTLINMYLTQCVEQALHVEFA